MKPAAADTVAGSAGEKVTPPSIGQEEGAVEGIAFYYHRRYYRQRTSSGERYDPHKLTAAHPTLPFGTVVLVTNAQNGRSVAVRVNDRGPFVPARIIDVSKAAAERLDMVAGGCIRDGVARANFRRAMANWLIQKARDDEDAAAAAVG